MKEKMKGKRMKKKDSKHEEKQKARTEIIFMQARNQEFKTWKEYPFHRLKKI